jgi:hypothetical protein
MRDVNRVLLTIGLGLVVVMGCSSGGTASTAPGSQAAPPSAAPGAASQAPAATSAASVAGVPSQAPGGGGNLAGVCSLATTDELAGILGTAVTARVIAGPPDTCDVQADGAPILAFVLTPSGGGAVYSAYAADPGATPISGLGDKAAYAPSMQLLVVLKGDTLLSMSAFDPARTPEERLELMKKVAAIAAGRM